MLVDHDNRNQGARTDLTTLREALDAGGLPEAKRRCPEVLLKYPSGAKLYVSIAEQVPRPSCEIRIFLGPTGTGKTSAAKTYPNAFWLNDTCPIWLDGYAGHTWIILDEFVGNIPLPTLLTLLDTRPLSLPFKGGTVAITTTHFVITSNKAVPDWYGVDGQFQALQRRINDYGTCYTADYPTGTPVE